MSESAETSVRKEPSQQRSRERVERMLTAATGLIAEKGSDGLKMGEVAARAGVPIGSLYQFFPDKSAIIRELAERHTAAGRACIEDALRDVATTGRLAAAFSALVDTYYEIFQTSPVTRDIWSGMQADRSLREIELADSRQSAAALTNAVLRANPSADPVAASAASFLIWQLGEATMRLAVSVDPQEGSRMVEAYKRMALDEINRLTSASGSR